MSTVGDDVEFGVRRQSWYPATLAPATLAYAQVYTDEPQPPQQPPQQPPVSRCNARVIKTVILIIFLTTGFVCLWMFCIAPLIQRGHVYKTLCNVKWIGSYSPSVVQRVSDRPSVTERRKSDRPKEGPEGGANEVSAAGITVNARIPVGYCHYDRSDRTK